jgi:hypothetical protein
MPVKSQAQRRKFAELLMKGEISEEVYERWNREAGSKVLPERVKPKTARGAKGKRKSASKAKSRTKRAAPKARKKTTSRPRRKTKKR